jgi:hypothetical protein
MDPAIAQETGLIMVNPSAKLLNKINEKVTLLKTSGLTHDDQEILKNRHLRFIWEEPSGDSNI